jgi:hypothetical protein
MDASLGQFADQQPDRAQLTTRNNALAETINGLYKTELIKPRKPWRTIEEVELATAEWVDWFGYAGDLGVSGIGPSDRR